MARHCDELKRDIDDHKNMVDVWTDALRKCMDDPDCPAEAMAFLNSARQAEKEALKDAEDAYTRCIWTT